MTDPTDMTSSEQTRHLEAKIRTEQEAMQGGAWFYWIAGLSAVNSALMLSGANLTFFAGLAGTTFFDVMVSVARATPESVASPLVIAASALGNLLLIALFVAAGYFARKGSERVYIGGIVLYAFDAILAVPFQLWANLVFHIVILLALRRGLKAMRRLKRLDVLPDPSAELSKIAAEHSIERRNNLQGIILGAIVIILLVVLTLVYGPLF